MTIKVLNHYLNLFGFYPKKLVLSLKGIPFFIKNYLNIKKKLKKGTEFHLKKIYPCLSDRFEAAGSFPLHYFYQDLFVANKIFLNNPFKHADVGSRIDGFVAHVASFREIEVFDIRKFNINIPNVKFVQADLMSENLSYSDYYDSISCLHAIEHFGLGRYGDNIDVDGYKKGLKSIYIMLKKGGRFYFSTPIGDQRIEFDAHRVFSVGYLLSLFEGDYKLASFSFISDNNILYTDVPLEDKNIENNFGCYYGCGIFELVKL